MSRRQKLFWLCVGAALFLLILSLIPSSYPICDEAEKAQTKDCPSYQVAQFLWIKIPQFLDVHNWLITALFAGLVTLFTWRLWQATNELRVSTDNLWDAGDRQLRHMEDASERQLRAYVSVSRIKIGRRVEMPDHIEIIVNTKNSGQTPAHDVTIWADCLVTQNAGTVELIGTKDPSVSKTMIAPGGKTSTSFFKEDFSPEQNAALYIDMKTAILIWGEVRYLDIFDKKRWTKFRVIQRGGPEFRDKPLSFTDEGNEAN